MSIPWFLVFKNTNAAQISYHGLYFSFSFDYDKIYKHKFYHGQLFLIFIYFLKFLEAAIFNLPLIFSLQNLVELSILL